MSDAPAHAAWTWRVAVFVFATLSIASLLLYFEGIGHFGRLAPALLAVETAGLVVLCGLAWRRGLRGVVALVGAGLWAGCIATAAYDLVRVPLIHARVPAFKAISYFGIILLGGGAAGTATEVTGWAYHLSNGVSFGLMYAAAVTRPRLVTAVLWGLFLEVLMLVTPYAEVFGYTRDAGFLSITLAAHAVYGAALWFALRSFAALRPAWHAVLLTAVPLVLGLVAGDFHHLYAERLPPSPPQYIGAHLYTCWSSPEPDRVALLWMTKRYGDPAAEFDFIEPYDKLRFGQPLDVPEAAIRRDGTFSATEVLVRRKGISLTPRLTALIHATHVSEITPWTMVADDSATRIAAHLHRAAASSCGDRLRATCLPSLFAELDREYGGHGP